MENNSTYKKDGVAAVNGTKCDIEKIIWTQEVPVWSVKYPNM